jgi:hypothetical protein
VRWSDTSERSRVPIVANGGEGPPLGKFCEKIAGHPSEALVKTSEYLAVMNSVSAANWPARSASLVPHFCSNQIS